MLFVSLIHTVEWLHPRETVEQVLVILNYWASLLFDWTAQSFHCTLDILPSFPKWWFGSGRNYSLKNWCHGAEKEVNKNTSRQTSLMSNMKNLWKNLVLAVFLLKLNQIRVEFVSTTGTPVTSFAPRNYSADCIDVAFIKSGKYNLWAW